MKVLGILMMLFGGIDLAGSYLDFDLWGGFLRINLPEFLWLYSAYIELLIGYLMIQFSQKKVAD